MDPTVTLAKIRKLIKEVAVTPADAGALAVARDLAEHVEALDEWIKNGGYLPEQWRS